MAPCAILNGHAERCQRHLAGRHIQRGGACGGEHHQAHHQAAGQFQDGQREDIQTGIVSEHRVNLAERRLVPPIEHRHPLAGGERRHEKRGDDHRDHNEGAQLIASRQRDSEPLAGREGDRRRREGGERHPHMKGQPGGGDYEHGHGQRGARGDLSGVDIPVAHLTKPHPIGQEVDGKGQEEKQDTGQEKDHKA